MTRIFTGPEKRLGDPSERFIKLSRNPDLPPPQRFEPTEKREGDIIL